MKDIKQLFKLVAEKQKGNKRPIIVGNCHMPYKNKAINKGDMETPQPGTR